MRISIRRAALGLLLLGLGWAGPARAGASATHTVVLHPMQKAYLRIDFDYGFAQALPPFANEPTLPGQRMVRILIPTVPPTPVLRNLTKHELYLKPDHSPDFTAGSAVTYKSRWDGHVLFDNLQVCTQRGALVVPYTIRLKTYESLCAGWFEVISGWTGEFDLDGRKYTLGIVDNLDGQIDDSDLLSLTCDKEGFRACPVPQTLWFAGHTFRLGFAFRPGSSEVVLEATLTEIQPPLGQLDIRADGCLQLRLRDDRQMALLNRPAGTVSLPVGNYRVDSVFLYNQAGQFIPLKFAGCDQTVPIVSGQVTPLRICAPLRNDVELSRDRNLLLLKYQLIGAGGERYEWLDRQHGPSFTVHQGPLKIGGGTFPFG